jgi:hypothetical protein
MLKILIFLLILIPLSFIPQGWSMVMVGLFTGGFLMVKEAPLHGFVGVGYGMGLDLLSYGLVLLRL